MHYSLWCELQLSIPMCHMELEFMVGWACVCDQRLIALQCDCIIADEREGRFRVTTTPAGWCRLFGIGCAAFGYKWPFGQQHCTAAFSAHWPNRTRLRVWGMLPKEYHRGFFITARFPIKRSPVSFDFQGRRSGAEILQISRVRWQCYGTFVPTDLRATTARGQALNQSVPRSGCLWTCPESYGQDHSD